MKLKGAQVALLVSLALLTVGGYLLLTLVLKRNLPQIQFALVRQAAESDVTTEQPTASPSLTPPATQTPAPTPTATPTPVLPQTRYDAQIATSPNDAALRLLRGDEYLDLRAYEWARADFEAAIRLDNALAQAYLGRGRALFYLRQWTAALGDFQQALMLRPDLADAHLWRGYVLTQLGDYAPAVDALRLAVLFDSGDPAKHTLLADALWRSGNPEEASAEASLALLMDDRYVEAYVVRSMAIAALGDVDGAEVELEQALAVAPYAPAVFNAQAWLYAWYRGDHLADAEKLARRAIAGAEDDLERARYLDTLGWVLYRLERYDEAISALEEATELSTIDGRVAYSEITAHLEQVRTAAQ